MCFSIKALFSLQKPFRFQIDNCSLHGFQASPEPVGDCTF